MNKLVKDRVCAVVVVYFPKLEVISCVLEVIRQQVANCLVVDNTPRSKIVHINLSSDGNIELHSLGGNRGIAAAHNIGINRARELGCTHVVLMDQDSVATPGMVPRLLAAERELKQGGEKVAVVAPRLYDKEYPNAGSFVRHEGIRRKRITCESSGSPYIRTDYVVSSGALISREAIEEIGEMDDSLFIDYVDIEWGLRARSKGYQSFGVCDAVLNHRLGDSVARLPGFSNFRAPVRKPLRHYYYFRNAIHIYRRPYVSKSWVVSDVYRLMLKFWFYVLITPPRMQNLKMMSLGIWHGIRGRMGSFTRPF